MEELKDASIHHTALKLTQDMQAMQVYGNLYKMVQKLACSPDVDKDDDFKATLETAIRSTGLETEIRNIVYHLIRSSSVRPDNGGGGQHQQRPMSSLMGPGDNGGGGGGSVSSSSSSSSDPLNYLRRAGVQWERRVKKSLNAMCTELKAPIHGQPRPAPDKEELQTKWEELSNYAVDLSSYRPVYATKDLLEVLLSLRGPAGKQQQQNHGQQKPPSHPSTTTTSEEPQPNHHHHYHQQEDFLPRWEFSHIALPVKNLADLRLHFSDLLRQEMSVPDFTAHCNRVLHFKHSPLCQQVLKKGCTPGPLRGELWAYVLGSHLDDFHIGHWENLKASVWNVDMVVDKLIFKDVQLTATNDDQYFVFEDVLYQVMLGFSRDPEIQEALQVNSGTVDLGNTTNPQNSIPAPQQTTCSNNNNSTGNSSAKCRANSQQQQQPPLQQNPQQYEGPPSGVVPFHGICMFAAPFAYLFDNPIKLYFTFRAFYVRYCHRLTTINTSSQGIVSLCLLYEKLLQTHEPQLWSHFRELQIQPIRVVFKWLMRAFSGHLPPEQLLILWDLVLGYDSLEILALLAIIILSFRKESLMQVSTIENIEAVLADLSSIKVLPLIQLALCRD